MNFMLQRDSDDGYATRGRWLRDDGTEFCKTLELPWKDNAPDVSCIPAMPVTFRLEMSPRHQVLKWTAQLVPNRAGIEIDTANWPKQLLGCIALGDAFNDDILGQGAGITGSQDAYDRLLLLLGSDTSFTLTILPIPPNLA